MEKEIDSRQTSDESLGRGEKSHLFMSGVIWLGIILAVVGFILYISIGFATLP